MSAPPDLRNAAWNAGRWLGVAAVLGTVGTIINTMRGLHPAGSLALVIAWYALIRHGWWLGWAEAHRELIRKERGE